MRLILFTLILLCSFPLAAEQQPILQIDSGGHNAKIQDVVFTPDGRYLVSASDDKLIRVWDIETGSTVRTFRGQIDTEDEGKIYAMALSPNGKWLAAGGWTLDEEIRLYDFASGELVTLLKGHTDVVYSLAFSPDSRYLVSGGGDYNAIIWDLESQSKLHILEGHTNDIYAVEFTQDSRRVVTGSDDHSLRLWDRVSGSHIATLEGHTDDVMTIAVSPDGTIASGGWDRTIMLWDGKTGSFIKTLATQETKVAGLTFSPDGRYLLSGTSGSGADNCYVYSVPSGEKLVTYEGHDNTVLATDISPDGLWAATAGGDNQEIHIWNLRDGKLKQRLLGVGSTNWAVGFSKDGKKLAWGKTWAESNQNNYRGALEYQISLPTESNPLGVLEAINQSEDNYLRARAEDKKYHLELRTQEGGDYNYEAILEIRYRNSTVTSIERGSSDGYDHLSYTFSPDRKMVVSGGSNGNLMAYNLNGEEIVNYIGHTADIWAVAFSPDGSLLASASDDQTVRLWNPESGENLLTLFHGSDGEWVAWTSSGHYIASPNGDKMVGWHINKGVDKAADYIRADEMAKQLNRPDIVANMVRMRSVKSALGVDGDFNLEGLIDEAVKD